MNILCLWLCLILGIFFLNIKTIEPKGYECFIGISSSHIIFQKIYINLQHYQ